MSYKARKLANGKTVYDIEVYLEARDASGRRRKVSRTAKTKQEAIKLDARLKAEAERGAVPDLKRTVSDLLDAWLAAGTWSPTTRYGYVRLVEREIRPTLGSVRLSRLGAQHLDTLYKDMRDEGHAGNSVRNVHRVLTAALNRARKWKWIAQSPADDATLGPILGGEGRVATEDEVRALLAAADRDAPDLGFAIRLACATGMRRSELAALDWSDFNLTATHPTVTVSAAVVDAGGQVHRKDTKTHATRIIPLGPRIVGECRARRGIGPVLDASPRALSGRLSALAERVGIEGAGFGWHSFRHYAGTNLAGVADLRTVADVLGHSTLRTTERYVHARAERTRAAIEALDQVHGPGRDDLARGPGALLSSRCRR